MDFEQWDYHEPLTENEAKTGWYLLALTVIAFAVIFIFLRD